MKWVSVNWPLNLLQESKGTWHSAYLTNSMGVGGVLCGSRLMPWAEELLLCFLFGILRGYCVIGCG